MAISTLSVSSRGALALGTQTKGKALIPVTRPAPRLRMAPIVAFRDEKSVGANSKATQASKQSWVQPLGKVPTNRKEEAESIVLAVAIFGFFTTGMLFVTIPMFQLGGHAFTESWQGAVNKTVGIKEPAISRPGYAPGPGPAAAPGTPAAGAGGNGCICP